MAGERTATELITPIVMPKWGLSMSEGKVNDWLVEEGTTIEVGMPILDVESDKIANAVEATDAGLLRRRIAQPGETLPVKALLGVMAPPEVSDAEIDAYVDAYQLPAAGDDEEAQAGPAYAFTEVDGIRVRYARRGGSGGDDDGARTAVLFLHGFGGDLDNWLFNLDAAAERAPVVALDLPGHGQSDVKLPGEASLAALAGFVRRFLDQVGVARVHAVGHSMGGAIAAQLALDDPPRVASLTLVNPAGLGEAIEGGYIDGFVQAASRRDLKPVLERLFADPGLVTRQMVDDVLKYKRLDGVDALLGELGAALFGGGRQADQPVARVDAQALPTSVLWGREDRVIPAAQAGQAPAGATVRVFDGAGHMLMMERAADVNAAIQAQVAAAG